MLLNYLTSAFRIVLKHRYFSLIHIGGLAIGLTAAIFVIHYARMEYTLDQFHTDNDRIYRVASARIRDGMEVNRFATTFAGAGPAIRADYPQVESFTRMYNRSRGGIVTWTEGNVRFREKQLFNVDSGFFKVFSFPILTGQPEDLFAPTTAFVEESTAKKYFGDTNPIGQRITFGTVEGVEEYEIRGVVRCPENSSIRFTFLLSYHGLDHFFGKEHYTNWLWLDFHTFLKLREGVDPKELESHFPDILKKFRGASASNSKLILQKLPEIYLQSSMEFETGKTGDASTVRILMVLGFVLLAIVALNFVNLSTAQAMTRAREVGIRKALGSHRGHLIMQFLTETALTNLSAISLSIVMLWLCLPWFNLITGRHLDFMSFVQGDLWKYLAIFFAAGTLLIGVWPALQNSSFRPVDVLKGNTGSVGRGALMRKGFVGFQALVSFSLVAVILIILDQVRFLKHQDIGITIENTLVVPTPAVVTGYDEYMSSLDAFKAEMMRDTRVTLITAVADCPGKDIGWISGARKLGAPLNEGISVYRADIDDTFAAMMNVTLLAGRHFAKNGPRRELAVNETALRQLNIESAESAIGQRILIGYDTMTIIGVTKDYHQVSPREPVSPTVYQNSLETPSWFLIRYENGNPASTIQIAERAFSKVYPTDFFDFFFLDEFYDQQYQLERRLASIMLVFCLLAVVVSSLGLLGLTWFTVSRRKKELAIRKVVGSTELQLFGHASGGVFLTTLIGCALGIPLTSFLMNQWLGTFAQHTSVNAYVFIVALATSLLVALVSVTGYTLSVIRTNPVVHLRHE